MIRWRLCEMCEGDSHFASTPVTTLSAAVVLKIYFVGIQPRSNFYIRRFCGNNIWVEVCGKVNMFSKCRAFLFIAVLLY